MPRGRAPTPTAILNARGSWRGKLRSKEPAPLVEAPPKPPTHLSAAAKAEWRFIMPHLINMGLIAQADRAALAMYCQAYARWVDAEKEIAEHGTVIKSPNNYPITSPYLPVANKAMEQMTKLLAEFGLSPAARARLHVQSAQKKPATPAKTLEIPALRIAN